MKTTIASLLAFYQLTSSQFVPAVPAVPAQPAVPSVPGIPGLALPPAGKVFGAYGQHCNNPSIDSECQLTIDSLTSQNPGFTKCEKDYDCCLCQSIQCGDSALGCTVFSAGNYGAYGVKDITIHGSTYGGHINCIGTNSCADTEITAFMVKDITAASEMALKNAVVTVTSPLPFFSLECIDVDACEGLQLEIVIPGPPAGYQCDPSLTETLWFNQISCVNAGSCRNMQLTIRNEGCQRVEIGKLQCIQPNSCDGATFNLIGDVSFNNCDLRGSAGTKASGIETCFDNLKQLLCPDRTSCREAVQTVLNPLNGFLLSCGNVGSCQKLELNINIDGTAVSPVTFMEGFKFTAEASGAGATITVNNKQNGVILNIQRIECSTVSACMDTTFIIGHDVSVGEIVCGPGACHQCQVKIDALSPGIPCDPNDLSVVITPPMPVNPEPVPSLPLPPVPVTPVIPEPVPPVNTQPVPPVNPQTVPPVVNVPPFIPLV